MMRLLEVAECEVQLIFRTAMVIYKRYIMKVWPDGVQGEVTRLKRRAKACNANSKEGYTSEI